MRRSLPRDREETPIRPKLSMEVIEFKLLLLGESASAIDRFQTYFDFRRTAIR
jgi:hypothetical protein